MTPAHLLSHLRAVVLGLLACAGLASFAPSARASTDVTAEYLYHRKRADVPTAVRDTRAQEALFAYCAELSGQPLA